jgi:carboxylesterase
MQQTLTIPSAEPFFLPGGRTGCLLLHGFTGTPKEMRMLGNSLVAAGYTVLAPRLFGHATSPEAMSRARWQDWLASVEDGMNLLKGCTDRQVVMGLSMGGVLSLLAAARYEFTGVVTFSAPSQMPSDPRSFLLPLIGWLNLHINKGKPDWRNAEAASDHVDYPYYPSRAIVELKKLINMMREELSAVTIPALLVQSRQDTSIPADSMQTLFSQINSRDKSKFWVENSGHVIIREPEREKIFAEVKSFLKRLPE